MSWNYRLVRDDQGVVTIREVFYGEDNSTIEGMTHPIIIQAYDEEGDPAASILDILEKVKSSIEKYGIIDDPWPDQK